MKKERMQHARALILQDDHIFIFRYIQMRKLSSMDAIYMCSYFAN
jgi:hypothetical protein